MLEDVKGGEWFGLWFLFLLACLASLGRRARSSRFLCWTILGQFASYTLVYFGTFYGPEEHIHASFHRLVAGVAPLAVLAVVGAAVSSYVPHHAREERGS
jgi:drug/metabolite transporter (DMT)-like permease